MSKRIFSGAELGQVGWASHQLHLYISVVSLQREDVTTALISVSLQAFEVSLRTILREVLSQYPSAAAVERPGLWLLPLRRPPSVFCVSRPGSSSVGSGWDLFSVLEVEPPIGDVSAMRAPDGAFVSAVVTESRVSLKSSPVGWDEPGSPAASSSRHFCASASR